MCQSADEGEFVAATLLGRTKRGTTSHWAQPLRHTMHSHTNTRSKHWREETRQGGQETSLPHSWPLYTRSLDFFFSSSPSHFQYISLFSVNLSHTSHASVCSYSAFTKPQSTRDFLNIPQSLHLIPSFFFPFCLWGFLTTMNIFFFWDKDHLTYTLAKHQKLRQCVQNLILLN